MPKNSTFRISPGTQHPGSGPPKREFLQNEKFIFYSYFLCTLTPKKHNFCTKAQFTSKTQDAAQTAAQTADAAQTAEQFTIGRNADRSACSRTDRRANCVKRTEHQNVL